MKKLSDFISESLRVDEQSINKKKRIEKDAIAAIQGNKSSIKNPIKTIGIITADYPDADVADYDAMPVSAVRKQNKKNRKSLNQFLKDAHFVWKPVTGKYGRIEQTVMIFNIDIETLIRLGKKYNQSSFIFVIVKGDGKAQYQYWDKKNGFSKADKIVNDEIEIVDGSCEDLFTRISKNFKFNIPFSFESCSDKIASIIESRQCIGSAEEAERRIFTSLNAAPSTSYYSRIMLYGDVSEI